MELHSSQHKIASVEVVDIILSLELGEVKGALGTELHTQDIFLGLDMNKPRRSGLELIIQAAQLGLHGTYNVLKYVHFNL